MPSITESILTSVKRYCGIEETDTSFDADLLMTTNAIFYVLPQLGIGPSKPYVVEDATQTWQDLLGDDEDFVGGVRQYVQLRARLLFDPPTNPQVMEALRGQIDEFQWRILLDADAKDATEEVTDE